MSFIRKMRPGLLLGEGHVDCTAGDVLHRDGADVGASVSNLLDLLAILT